MKDKAFLSFVFQITEFSEAQGSFVRAIASYLSQHFDRHELVIVDNSESREVRSSLVALTDSMPGLATVVGLTRRQSADVALLSGLDKCIGDFVFQMDDIGSEFDLKILGQMYEKVKEGFDIVRAVSPDGQPATTKLFYYLFSRLSNIDSGVETYRILLVSRRALNQTINAKQRFRYQKAILALSGFSNASVSFEGKGRPKKSGTLLERVHLAVDLLVTYSGIGYRVGWGLSILFMLFSLSMGGYALFSYLFREHISSGWTSLMGFISFAFASLFFLLTILCEYMRHILLELQGTPLYLVESYHTNVTVPEFLRSKEVTSETATPRLQVVK